MLNKGKLGSVRVLSRPSVEVMTTDQLTSEQKAVSGLVSGYFDDHGWGFGVSVVTRRVDVAGCVGTVDSPSPPDVCLDFWTSVYRSIDD